VRDRAHLPREREEEPLPPEQGPAVDLLQLQRSAGNRAVAAMLSRQPTEEKAATMTAGLGDDIGVIPLDSFSWGSTGNPGSTGAIGHQEVHEVSISFSHNPASAAIARAVSEGTPIENAFISTSTTTVDFTDVLLTGYQDGDRGSTVTLNFASMKLRK
jgi:hypothetical protein